jgi:hypothetical protein
MAIEIFFAVFTKGVMSKSSSEGVSLRVGKVHWMR